MGVCSSKEFLSPEEEKAQKEAKANSKKIDQELAEDEVDDRTNYKLLLLGPGGSGKSTFFKQMTEIYGDGFTENARQGFKGHINRNVIAAIQSLCQASESKGEWNTTAENDDARETILSLDEEALLNPTIGTLIQQLWKDPGIQLAFKNSNLFQLDDSAEYYFSRVAEIVKDNYLPSKQDVFRSRVSTTGIIKEVFTVDGHRFLMFDVGGQRSERKKWIHCFENVTAVLFVAAISAYDQMLYEDDATNRMEEALTLFQDISNNKWFEDKGLVLFLNKDDIFKKKLTVSPLKNFFPEYVPAEKPEDEYEQASNWISDLFENQQEDEERTIYIHITCATDTNNIYIVFNAVKDVVIKQSLQRAGIC